MKLIALAAALAFGMPAFAQDTMTQQDQTVPAPAPAQTPPPTAVPADAATPPGGYQPSQPPLSGTPVAGQRVIFQQAPSPDQAYPAPAPLAEYPVCKRGQTDKCRNRGGR